jgi:hypothetical protein
LHEVILRLTSSLGLVGLAGEDLGRKEMVTGVLRVGLLGSP